MTAKVASFNDINRVVLACKEKNMKWSVSEKSQGLLATVLQRQTCISVNNIVLGVARLPLPLNYTGIPSEKTFTMPDSPKVFHCKRRSSIHESEDEPLAKRT
jgi:hypothetical protein